MSKKVIALISLIAIMALLLCACESFKYDNGFTDFPSADAAVTNNGSLAVKQGDYLYFINAQTAYEYTESSQNYFGHKNNAMTGAIYRAKVVNGALTDIGILVPKNAMTSNTKGGIYVFGDWIYYTSPSTRANASGEVLATQLVFYRTKIDGSKTQEICTVETNSFDYVVTSASIMYYSENTLYRVDTTAKRKFKVETVAEELTACTFVKNANYNPATISKVQECAFYTKAHEDDTLRGNELWAVNAAGETTCVITDSTFCADRNSVAALQQLYTISPVNYLVTEGGVTLYYTKANYVGGATNNVGVFGYNFTGSAFAFDTTKETMILNSSQTTIYPATSDSFYYMNGNVLTLAKAGQALTAVKDFESAITVQFFSTINNVNYLIYLSSSSLKRYPLSADSTVIGNAQDVLASGYSTSWLKAVVVDGMLIYCDSDDSNYVHGLQLDTLDGDSVVNKRLSEFNK